MGVSGKWRRKQQKKPWYKKWWVWLIIVVVIVGVGSNIERDGKVASTKKSAAQPATAAKEEPEPEPEEEVIAISAIDLWKEYKNNEVAADEKYKGNLLEVSGKIDDIGKNAFGTIYVTLDTDGALGDVWVYFSKKEAESVAKLKKGQKVTVVGKGDGFSVFSANIEDAIVK